MTTTTQATVTTTTTRPLPVSVGVYRPSGCDLSLRWENSDTALTYCDLCGAPHTCSQYERDTKEWTLVDRAMYVTQFLGDLCPDVRRTAYTASFMTGILSKLAWPYEARDLMKAGGGLWIVPSGGHHYRIERNLLKKYRACLMRESVRLVAAGRLASAADLRNLLDVNGMLMGPAAFSFRPLPPYDGARDDVAPVDSRAAANAHNRALVNRPADLDALAAVVAAHAGSGDVKGAGVRYEALCGTDESCLTFRKMKSFRGSCDSRWTATECSQWRALTHVFFSRWADAQKAGLMGKSREADSDHHAAHTCENDATPEMLVIFSCEEKPANVPECLGPNGERGKNTCRAYLPFMAAKYPGIG